MYLFLPSDTSSPAELIARLGGDHVIEFSLAEGRPTLPPDAFGELPGVLSALVEDGTVVLRVAELHVVLPAVLDRVRQAGALMARLTTRHASLEDVFVQLTGRHLRDERDT